MSLELQKLLERFSDIVVSISIVRFEQVGSSLRLRARADLIDGSRLFIRETIIGGVKRKYSYHWQKQSDEMIMRWDNAPVGILKLFRTINMLGWKNTWMFPMKELLNRY